MVTLWNPASFSCSRQDIDSIHPFLSFLRMGQGLPVVRQTPPKLEVFEGDISSQSRQSANHANCSLAPSCSQLLVGQRSELSRSVARQVLWYCGTKLSEAGPNFAHEARREENCHQSM